MVVFKSNDCDKFNQSVTYLINGRHEFHFRIIAEIVPVTLSLDKDVVEFRFPEESTEMFTTSIVKLTNNGNAPAKFKWIVPEESYFTVEPIAGEV